MFGWAATAGGMAPWRGGPAAGDGWSHRAVSSLNFEPTIALARSVSSQSCPQLAQELPAMQSPRGPTVSRLDHPAPLPSRLPPLENSNGFE